MNFAGGLGALGAFTEGYTKGQDEVRKRKMEDARFEMDQKRLQMDLDKANDDKAMREEMKAVGEKPKLTKMVTVKTAAGEMSYEDEKLAKEAYDHALSEGGPDAAQMVESYSAGGQRYEDKHDAEHAIEAMHTPAARARRKAEIAEKYSNPQLAGQYMENYRKLIDANRRDVKEAFVDAYQRNDIEAAAKLYSDRLSDGVQAQVVPGEKGGFAIVKTKNGKPVGEPQVFANADEFWNGKSQGEGKPRSPGLLQAISVTPDNALEMWKAQEGLTLQHKAAALQERVADAGIAQTKAETAAIPRKLDIAAKGADASMVGASASATNAATAQYEATKPKIYGGLGKDGQAVYTGVRTPYDPNTKTYGLEVQKPQVATDMYVPGYMKDQPKDLLGLGGLGGPAPLTPEQLQEQMKNMFPKRNLGGGISTSFPKKPGEQ